MLNYAVFLFVCNYFEDCSSSVAIFNPVAGKRIEELHSLQMALQTVQQQMDHALLQKEKNGELMRRMRTDNEKHRQSKRRLFTPYVYLIEGSTASLKLYNFIGMSKSIVQVNWFLLQIP